MKKKSIVAAMLIALVSFNLWAATGYVDGEGRFYAGDDDSLAFVKAQLTNNAFHDVISKELTSMGLDANLFWTKWNARFEAYFQASSEALKKKYGIDDENVSALKKNEYQKALRVKRLELMARYGELARAISSYSIKRMTRSTQVPNSRFMSLQAKVDRRTLNSIYFDFVRDGESRHFSNVYITGRFTLEGGTWSDVGVAVEKDFTNVVLDHWQKWMSENFKDRASNFIITDESMEQSLQESLKQPLMTSVQLANVSSKEGSDESTGLFSGSNSAANGLWLQLNFKLKKIDEDELLSQRTFLIEGNALLLDLKFRRPLMANDYPYITQDYSTADLTAMSSALASFIYRLPITDLKAVTRDLSRMSSGERLATLTLEGAPHIGVAQTFITNVVDKGLSQQLSATLKEATPTVTGYYLNFNGESEKLVGLLRSFNNSDLPGDLMVTLPDENNPFHFKIVKKFVPASNTETPNGPVSL